MTSKHMGKTPLESRKNDDNDLGQTERVSQRDVRASHFLEAEQSFRVEYGTLDAKMEFNTLGIRQSADGRGLEAQLNLHKNGGENMLIRLEN